MHKTISREHILEDLPEIAEIQSDDLRVGLEKVSTISISCKASGEHADVGDGDPRFC
ncbi:hypothetical protein [Sinorhizobium meliloti]|uniref:hypothetical protein n=1 Tax=Rhizobium meliloti TaxID=382 RepID=UPI001F35FB8E|nr:hypothetical protein [Sinorhizobium meliloti]